MAAADYRLCDLCDGKAFYDSDLTYESSDDPYVKARGATPYRIAGKPQYDDPVVDAGSGLVLGYVGDWGVLCFKCAKTHRIAILPRQEA